MIANEVIIPSGPTVISGRSVLTPGCCSHSAAHGLRSRLLARDQHSIRSVSDVVSQAYVVR